MSAEGPVRVLVAGVGDVLSGDDGFGVEVARRLAGRAPRAGVRVAEFGIRSFDLSFALLDGCDVAILVDATKRGGPPGSLYVLEPTIDVAAGAPAIGSHSLEPASVLAYVRELGGRVGSVRVVGCEPLSLGEPDAPSMGLSAEVAAAIEPACEMVERLCDAALRGELDA